MSQAVTIITGDAVEQLRTLPDESVHCCVTSPPYWGLRDYSCEGQLGLEKTPEEYVSKMVEVFSEVRRVLRKDGTLWLNLGDSYASNPDKGGSGTPNGRNNRGENYARAGLGGLKPKDLCGIPWRLAFALQADGWWLRSDIIWHKPNPMPESCTDRPTKSHEYLFLLTKSANYFYDAEAIKERGIIPEGTLGAKGSAERFGMNGVNSRPPEYKVYDGQRNKRSVWTVATAPYPEAHFATYPPDLIKPCIMAGTSAKGCCAKCGSPWERFCLYEGGRDWRADEMVQKGIVGELSGCGSYKRGQSSTQLNDTRRVTDTYWQPSCRCMGKGDPFLKPCTVLDPFAGSGTTGSVALELGRKAILIELNPKYVELIKRRCDVTPGLALA